MRLAQNLPLEQLAQRLGVTSSTVSQLETAERVRRIKLESLERVAEALGCDLVYALVPRKDLMQTAWESYWKGESLN